MGKAGPAMIMRNNYDRSLLLLRKVAQDFADLPSRAGVERSGRLVGQQDFRIGQQSAGDSNSLLLTSAECLWFEMKLVAES